MRRTNVRMMSLALSVAAASLAAVLPSAPLGGSQNSPSTTITRPAVSEAASPVETIAPVARDGHRGLGLLRKPPGIGPFPAVVIIHGGLTTVPRAMLETVAAGPMASRLLAAGYVIG